MTDYAGLIERLESGSGADVELQAQLWAIADNRTIISKQGFPFSGWIAQSNTPPHDECVAEMPPYLQSLDAALALAEAMDVPWNGVLVNAVKRCDALTRLPRQVLIETLTTLSAARALQEQHNE